MKVVSLKKAISIAAILVSIWALARQIGRTLKEKTQPNGRKIVHADYKVKE
jgi:hypothetical protein